MATLCVELRRNARAPRVAQTSVCVLFSAPTRIKTTQAEACATGLPQNSREKSALESMLQRENVCGSWLQPRHKFCRMSAALAAGFWLEELPHRDASRLKPASVGRTEDPWNGQG
jgi:hypothetical protein